MNYQELEKQELIDALLKLEQQAVSFKEVEHKLNERVKELSCLYGVTKIIQHPDKSFDEKLQAIVETIPPGFQYPEIASASIVLNGQKYSTEKCSNSLIYLLQPIEIHKKKIGEIKVCYAENSSVKNPEFIAEETALLESIAVRLAEIDDKYEYIKQLEASESKLRNIVESISEVLFEYDANGIITYISPAAEKIFGYKVEQVIGQDFGYFTRETPEKKVERLKNLENKKTANSEFIMHTVNEVPHWCQLSTKALFNNGVFSGGAGVLTDITERKQVESELKRSEALYRSILNSSPDNITLTDMRGNILLWSANAHKMFGAEADFDFKGHSILEYIHESEHERTMNSIAGRLEAGTLSTNNQFKAKKIDGTIIFIEVNWEVIRNEDNIPVNMVFIIRDVTDKIIADEKLKAAEKTYRRIVENIGEAIYDIDINGIIQYISPSIYKISGFYPEEIIGRKMYEILGETAEIFQTRVENLVLNNSHSRELIMKNRLGEDRWIRFSTNAVIEDGKFIGGTGTMSDITDSKNMEIKLSDNEKLYSTILNVSPDVIVLCSPEGIIEYVSPSTYKIFGYDSDKEYYGKSIIEFVDKSDVERVHMYSQMKLEGIEIGVLEYKGKRADGSTFEFEANTDVIRDENGIPLKVVLIIRDISSKNQMLEQLRKSEERYRNIFETVQDAYYEATIEGTLLDISPSIASISKNNFTRESIIGSSIVNLYADPNDRVIFQQELMKHNKVIDYELDFKYGDLIVPVSVTSSLIFDDNGVPTKISGSLRDITERRKAQTQIKESEALYHSIMTASPDGIAVTDLNGNILLVSPRSCDMFGANANTDFTGRNLLEFLADEDKEKAMNNIAKMFENKGEGPGEYNAIKNDGTIFPVEVNGDFIRNEAGEIQSLIFIIRDITERKKAEVQLKKLSMAVEQSPVSIVLTDIDGNIEYTNPKACETTGYSQEELIGQNPRVLQSGETPKDEYVDLWERISAGKEWQGLFHNKKKTGELYWESSTIAPITDDNGKIISYVAIKEDITDRKFAEEELIKFRTISDSANYGNAIADLDGNIIYVNRYFANLLGYEMEEMVGKHLSMSYDKNHSETVDQIFKELFAVGSLVMQEVILKTKKGEQFPVLINASLILNQNNEPAFISSTFVDISNIRKSEEALKRSEENLSYAQRIAKMGSWEFNLKTLQLTGSENYYRMLGLEPFDSKIDLYQHFLSLVHPDDMHLITQVQDTDFINNNQDSSTFSFDVRFILADNVIKIYQNNIVPIFDKGILTELRGVNVDITEQRLKDEQINKLSLAVTQSPVSVVITNTEGIIEFVNPAFEQITGLKSEFVKGKNTRILKSGMNDDSIYVDLWKTIKSGKAWENEWINKRRNGEFYWELISISPIRNSLGVITNYLAIKQDITQKKNFEKEILELNQNLEKKIQERTSELELANVNLVKEIDVRKRFEKALSDSEQKYRLVVENINEIIFQTDNDGNWLFLNQSWEKLTGFSLQESMGQLFLNYVHPDDRQRNLEAFEPLINGDKDYCRHEVRYLKKAGGYCWIEVFARLGYDKNGEATGTYGSLRDITERKRAEEFENEMLLLSAQLTGVKLSEIDKALNLALSRIGQFLNADRSYIFEIDSEHELMSNTYEWCNTDISAEIENLQGIPIDIFPEWMDKMLHHDLLIIPSVADLPDDWAPERDILEPQGIKSLISLPLFYEDKLMGFVGLDSVKTQRSYSTAEINILKVWSSMLSSLLINKKNESLLEITRQNLEIFFNTIDDFMWVLDQQGNITHVNDTVLKRLGFTLDELKTKTIIDLHPVERRDEVTELVQQMLCGEEDRCSVPLITKSGESISVESHVKHGFWNGQASLFVVTKDISQIQLSEQKFSTAFHSSSAVMAITRLSDNTFLDVNNAFLNILGFTKEEIIGKSNSELHIYNEKNLGESFEKQRLDGFSLREIEVNVLSKYKEPHVFLLSTELIYIGQDACLLSVSIDITARKKAEAQLEWNKSLLEMMSNSSPLGFLVVDNRTDDILYFNHRFCEIWEIEAIEDRMRSGELNNSAIIPYCLPVLEDIEAFSESCKPLQSEENRAVIADEIPFTENRTIHRYSTQIRGEDDTYYGRFYIFEDVTEEKKAAQDLLEARNEAEKANLAKSEFLSRMSHELRTPLNSILGFAQLLEMGELNKGQTRGVNHILNSGKHLLNLINEVLDISRIESGRVELSFESIQLNLVFNEMFDILQPIATKNDIRFHLIDSPTNNTTIWYDKKSLKQILLNLMNNAVKYNVQGGEVIIRTEMQPELNRIRISISDTGIGISEENIAKLFIPFERVGAEKSAIEGTGLGLAVVKKLVNAIGGNFGVESEVGKGSTFWFDIQLHENATSEDGLPCESLTSTSETQACKGKILCIEDNQSNIDLIEQILVLHRPEISLISEMNGAKAAIKAQEVKPDLILLDLNLPDIHGSEVLKQIKDNYSISNIPVVIISADAMAIKVKELLNLGAESYLTKPLDIQEFLETIDNYIYCNK